MAANIGKLSAKTIWGKVVLFLKEHNQVALHVACGDITDVKIENEHLVVHVEDGMLANLLSDGKREIENALRWQGLDLSLKIETIKKQIPKTEQDLAKLQKNFNDFLTIKD